MKKILVLTALEIKDSIDHICVILKDRYRNKYDIQSLKSMSEQDDAFDYVYIIITDKTTEEEMDLLTGTAVLWTNYTNTSISYLQFDTIKNASAKRKKRRETKLKRDYPDLNYQN